MSQVNTMRLTASQMIVQIMNADAPAEERAEHLELIRAHVQSAHDDVVSKAEAKRKFLVNVRRYVEERISALPAKEKTAACLGLNQMAEAFRKDSVDAENSEDWDTRWKVQGDNAYDGKHVCPDISGDEVIATLARIMDPDRLRQVDSIRISILGDEAHTYTQVELNDG